LVHLVALVGLEWLLVIFCSENEGYDFIFISQIMIEFYKKLLPLVLELAVVSIHIWLKNKRAKVSKLQRTLDKELLKWTGCASK
jgi:hypothetical protein